MDKKELIEKLKRFEQKSADLEGETDTLRIEIKILTEELELED